MTSTSDEAFRKHVASFNDMAIAEEWKRRYEAHDSLVKALEPFANLGVGVGPDDQVDDAPYRILRGAIHNARAALSQAKGGK